MASKKFKPSRKAASFKPRRNEIRKALWAVPLLLLAGAWLDPDYIGPVWPLAAPAEIVTASFVPCGTDDSSACVIDGDMFRLGDRTIRIVGIDAPEFAAAKCPAEAQLAGKSAVRLLELLNQGHFDMVGHRLQMIDRHGRYLMKIKRGGQSIGATMVEEGLAHRYLGFKTSWC